VIEIKIVGKNLSELKEKIADLAHEFGISQVHSQFHSHSNASNDSKDLNLSKRRVGRPVGSTSKKKEIKKIQTEAVDHSNRLDALIRSQSERLVKNGEEPLPTFSALEETARC
jgi:hypothetical protein